MNPIGEHRIHRSSYNPKLSLVGGTQVQHNRMYCDNTSKSTYTVFPILMYGIRFWSITRRANPGAKNPARKNSLRRINGQSSVPPETGVNNTLERTPAKTLRLLLG